MAEEVGFGVVGLGMGQTHCRDIADAQGARLVAVCDVDEGRLNPVAEKYRVKKYARYEEMLRDSEIDVVNVCTYSGMHADMAIAAMEAGKHVIGEKPADVSLAKIDAMVAASRRTGRKLQVIFQERFMPVNRRIKEAIEAGRLGRLIGCHGDLRWWRAQSYYDNSADHWRGTWRWDGGGSLMNQGIHTVDLMQWFMGPVESVFGVIGVYTHRIETEDKAAAVLRFESGAIGTINTMTCAYPGLATELFIQGERGAIEKSDSNIRTWRIQAETKEAEEAEQAGVLAQFGPKEKGASLSSDPNALPFRGHRVQVEDMVQAIREGRAPTITGEHARHAVAINLAIYESARTGREVRVRDVG